MKKIPMEELLAIPEGCELVYKSDQFAEGGPIVIAYRSKTCDQEELERNRKNMQYVIDDVVQALIEKRVNQVETGRDHTGNCARSSGNLHGDRVCKDDPSGDRVEGR